MNKHKQQIFLITGLALNLSFAGFVSAASAEAKQVDSKNDYIDCSSPLFHRLEVVEKTGHRLPLRTHKGRLKAYVDQYEDICPWQREGDINGDRKTDWVGIVGERGKYSLIAYISSGITYKIHTIKTYSKFPEDTYIDLIPTADAKKITGKAHQKIPAPRVITENKLGGVSTAWYWNGKVITELGGFLDETKLPDWESQRERQDDDKDYQGPKR